MKSHWKMEHLCQHCNKKYKRLDHFIAHQEQCQKENHMDVAQIVDFDHIEVEDNEIENTTEIGFDQSYSLADLSMAFSGVDNEVLF